MRLVHHDHCEPLPAQALHQWAGVCGEQAVTQHRHLTAADTPAGTKTHTMRKCSMLDKVYEVSRVKLFLFGITIMYFISIYLGEVVIILIIQLNIFSIEQPKTQNIFIIIIENQRKQEIFTFMKLEANI